MATGPSKAAPIPVSYLTPPGACVDRARTVGGFTHRRARAEENALRRWGLACRETWDPACWVRGAPSAGWEEPPAEFLWSRASAARCALLL